MTAYGIVIASLRSNPEESKYQSMRQFEMHPIFSGVWRNQLFYLILHFIPEQIK
jgi:hypothetical protein